MAKRAKKQSEKVVDSAGSDQLDNIGVLPDEEIKSDVVGFRGGLGIRLNKKNPKTGVDLKTELSQFVSEELDVEMRNHSVLVKNINKWQKQYKGKKKPKSRPWIDCANVAVPTTRYIIDTILVRILDSIFNRKKVVIFKALKPEFEQQARDIEEGFEWYQKNILKLRDKLTDPLIQQLKCGTGVINIDWESKKRVVYRPADDAELKDKSVKKYSFDRSDGSKGMLVKDVQTVYEGPQIFSVPREDVIASSDARDFQDAYICGFRMPYRRGQLRDRAAQGIFDPEAVSSLCGVDRVTENEETRAELQGKGVEKTKYSDPYEVWHLWVKYDVDFDGQEDDIKIGFHRESKTILYAQYNPIFTGNRPFVKFVGYPVEYSFDGESLCEALYPLQEEVDTIENQRLDRMTLLNNFVTMSKEGANLDNFKWTNGRHYVVNDTDLEQAFRVVQVPDVFPSTFNEEMNLIELMHKIAGITPISMGIQTAERPVFKDTAIQQEESNKKFKSYIDNLRCGIQEMVYQILELFAQYQPTFQYRDDSGSDQIKTMEMPEITAIRDGLGIDLSASTEMISQEVRREIGMMKYQILTDYMTKTATMVQALTSPGVPPGFKKYLLKAGTVGAKVLRGVMADMESPDSKEIVIDPKETLTPQDYMTPPMPQVPPGGPAGQRPPQGPPGPPQGPPNGPPPGMVPAEM